MSVTVIVAGFVLSAGFQLVPGAIFAKVPLLVAGFLLGVTAQSIKLCVDTLVQAHVDDELKGRVFVLYDMVFNVALVIAAGIAAVILPADGRSVLILAVLAALLSAARGALRRRQPRHEPGRRHRVAQERAATR